MKNIHLVIPDLFLPEDIVAEVCAGLHVPVLEKLLGRGTSTSSARTEGLSLPLENLLCELFGVACEPDAPVAPVSAVFDGLVPGCWLRADPVHLRLQRDQMLLLPDVNAGAEEAAQMCASLNAHFAGQGMVFFAPHPQRWYVRLDGLPRIRTTPLSQVAGRDVRGALPTGEGATHWHRIFNEIQMLLFAHPLNDAREARGELTINSVWLWGGGCNENISLQKNYDSASSDEMLVEMLALAADIPFAAWPGQWHAPPAPVLSRKESGHASEDRQLLVWTGLRSALQDGDLAAWRNALQDFENGYAQPLWQALRSGKIGRLQMDVTRGSHLRRMQLVRGDSWAFWRRARHLAEYSMV